jgi:hypothetical protein
MASRGFGTPRAFAAKYPGRCGSCERNIEPGDLVRYDDDELVHNKCAGLDLVTTAPSTGSALVCPECNIDHAGDCF